MNRRTALPAWQALRQHADTQHGLHLKSLFAGDQQRFERYSLTLDRFLIDYSKNLINDDTLNLLLQLAREADVEGWRAKMFAGARINRTEDRAVLHVALRNRAKTPIYVDGVNVTNLVEDEISRMRQFVYRVRSGEWCGATGKAIQDVVNLGVGGSHLGPQMITDALKHCSDERLRVHYVSNVDGTQLNDVLRNLNPESTLFIISSKSFGTTETLTNATTAQKWLAAGMPEGVSLDRHFVAVTALAEKARAFGLPADHIFHIWDWVGGRFSLWSAIGLPIALYLGFERFMELLEGAHELDQHFRMAPLAQNAPVILALLAVWNASFLGRNVHAILPYEQALHLLPSYLQQAEMESNGKSVTLDGEPVDYATVSCMWGGVGINGQHAFYQYLHQGNNIASADFIGAVETTAGPDDHHDILMANLFAQTEALMQGVDLDEVKADLRAAGHSDADIERLAPHKVHPGNRPTTTLLLKRIDPRTLGALVALYEHKIFVQGVLLNLCSFDQWGVELGKKLATTIQKEIADDQPSTHHDASTQGLMAFYRHAKRESLRQQLPRSRISGHR